MSSCDRLGTLAVALLTLFVLPVSLARPTVRAIDTANNDAASIDAANIDAANIDAANIDAAEIDTGVLDVADEDELPPARVTWRKSYADALEEARVRNAVIYLVFSQDSDSRVPGSLFDAERLAQYAEEGLVLLAAHPKFEGPLPHRPDRRVDPATRRRVERCPYYRSIHCRDHQAVARDVPSSLTPTRSPCEFLLAPDGQVILDGREHPIAPSDFDPAKYIAAFHAAQRKLGRRTVAFSVYRQLVEVEADVERTQTLGRGAPRLREILRKKSRFPKPFRERVETAEERYLEAGRKWITEVVESSDGVAKKRERLEQIASAFDGFPIESEARAAARDLPDGSSNR